MATITLRLVKGTPLTNQEVDDNFSNINLAKVEIGRDLSGNIYYPVVSGLRGRDVSSTSPSNAQVLTWLASSNAWVPVSSQSTLISVGSFTGTVSNANLLSSILEVDGSGSNLDADKLDGNDGTFYLNYGNLNNKPAANITLTGDVTGSVDSVLTGNSTSLSVSTSYNYTNLDSRFLKLTNPTQQIVTSYINFQGNVTFSGNVTTISANNLIIDDNFIYLNANNTSNNDDFGFVGNYNDGTYQHAGFFRDSSDNGTWKIFDGYLPEPDDSVNIDTANASFRLANLAINKITANVFSGIINTTVGSCNFFAGGGAGGGATGGYHNIFIGNEAGSCNMGSSNNFFGQCAGFCNTTGYNNNFFGQYAGALNTTGSNNFFMGCRAGRGLDSGQNNIVIGLCAGGGGSGISGGTFACNIIMGPQAGAKISTGANNNFFGQYAGFCNTVGSGNTFFGAYSGTKNTQGCNNIFMGYRSGCCNEAGSHNNMFGFESGRCSSNGCYNNFMGFQTGFLNTGNFNHFFGFRSGQNNTSGNCNIFFGDMAGRYNTSGQNNNFLGSCAGYNNSSGCYNAFLGYRAGISSTSGNHNIYFGSDAGGNVTTGNNNIMFGCLTSCAGLTDATSNVIIMASGGLERLKVDNGNLSILSCSGNIIASQGFFNNLVVKNISEYVANTATFSTTTESTLYEFSKNVYSSGKFTITGKQGSNVQISEMLVAQDGTTASSTEYGVVKTSNVTVFTGNVDISGDNVRVRVIGGSAISTKYTLAGSLLDL